MCVCVCVCVCNLQDSERHSVALLFRNEDGTSHTLNLQLPEYSAVLVDCLEGVCLKREGESAEV